MTRIHRNPFAQALALLAATGLCAGLANTLAEPDRKLAWTGRPPAQGPPPAPAPVAPVPVGPAPPAPDPPLVKAALRPRPAERFPPSPTVAIREIGSSDAWTAYGLRVPFLDARRTADFTDGHVQGAWSAPVWETDCERRITEFEARANPGPRDPIVIYCSGGCKDSHLLAAKLQGMGYRNLLIYTEGFPDWTAKARPVDRGARP